MDESRKEKLIAQFSTYLETEYIEEEEDNNREQNPIDLFSLFTELAALRNEVKLEARQVNVALEIFKETFDTVQTTHKQLTSQVEHCRTEHINQKRELTRNMLLAFLDIYDRLEAGMSALNNYNPPLFGYFCKREISLILSLQKGQAMTLGRVIQILSRYRVRPLDVLEKPLDPHRMRVVEVDCQDQIKNGIVTAELRKGFMWEEEILRPAEVKVNKISQENS